MTLNKVQRFKIECLHSIIENLHLIATNSRLLDRTWWLVEIVHIILNVTLENVLKGHVEVEQQLKLVLIQEIVILEWPVSRTKQLLIKALVKSIWKKANIVWAILNVHLIWFVGLYLILILHLVPKKEDVWDEHTTTTHLNSDGFLNIDTTVITLRQMVRFAKVGLRIKIQPISTKQFAQKYTMFTLIRAKWPHQCHAQLWELAPHAITSLATFILTCICSDLVNVVLMQLAVIVQLLTNLWWQPILTWWETIGQEVHFVVQLIDMTSLLNQNVGLGWLPRMILFGKKLLSKTFWCKLGLGIKV